MESSFFQARQIARRMKDFDKVLKEGQVSILAAYLRRHQRKVFGEGGTLVDFGVFKENTKKRADEAA